MTKNIAQSSGSRMGRRNVIRCTRQVVYIASTARKPNFSRNREASASSVDMAPAPSILVYDYL